MSTAPLPLPDGHRLVVTGSLAANPDDRTHDSAWLRPVAVVDADGTVDSLDNFAGIDPLGLSAFVFTPDRRVLWSVGDDFCEADTDGATRTHLDAGLVDVHEIIQVGDVAWLSSTGSDELVGFDLAGDAVHRRISLSIHRGAAAGLAERPADGEEIEAVDKFHTNQAFADMDGRLHCLVHHVGGRQLIRRVRAKVLKSQGNGGVIDLETGDGHDLGLKAPHSVRIVGDEYWVFDSGRARIQRHDPRWQVTGHIATSGFGRGAAQTGDGRWFFAGMSPIRARYRDMTEHAGVDAASVDVIDTASGAIVVNVPIPHIEQVNNVYLVDDGTASRLAAVGV